MRQRIGTYLTVLTLLVLIANCAHLGVLIADEVDTYKARGSRFQYLPRDSSLRGIDSHGHVTQPELHSGGRLAGGGYLLLFVLDHRTIEEDIAFWNKVVESTGQAQTGKTIQYWGICSDGTKCNQYQSVAKFQVMSFLDPYQMHTAATTIKKHGALLYDQSMSLKTDIPDSAEPLEHAAAILKYTK